MSGQPVLSTRDQVLKLIDVQELDLQIQNLSNRKAQAPEQIQKLQQEIAQKNKKRAEYESKHTEVEKAYRQLMAAVEMNQDRMTRANSKLEDVSNTNEFSAANREIEQLKKLADELAVKRAEKEKELATFKAETAAIDGQVREIEEKISGLASQTTSVVKELDAQLGELEGKRNTFIVSMDKQLLARYDRVRKAKNGVAVAPIVEGRCKGCNMMVPPQMVNLAHKGKDLISCSSCHRILFIPPMASHSGNGSGNPS